MKTNLKRTLGISMAVILSVTVLVYSYFRTKNFMEGPIVTVSTPKNGEILSTPLIKVEGISRNISYLSIDGRKIFTDKEGKWSEKLLLQTGLNIIEIQADDRFGRDIKQVIKVAYREIENS